MDRSHALKWLFFSSKSHLALYQKDYMHSENALAIAALVDERGDVGSAKSVVDVDDTYVG